MDCATRYPEALALKDIYQVCQVGYRLDLKERQSDTCELAQKELQKSQVKQHKYYDRKPRVRTFQAGDNALILLSTDSNQSLLQWQAAFKMVE